MNSRLTGKIRNFDGSATSIKPIADDKGFPNKFGSDVLTKLADYEDLEEQGRLLKLPCKVGNTVWVIATPLSVSEVVAVEKGKDSEYKIYKCYVDSVLIPAKGEIKMFRIICEKTNNIVSGFITDLSFGKGIFLTKGEAEAKLKELKGE